MRAQRSGRLINISSVGGKLGEPFGSWYHATKFAVEGLSDSLRMEVQRFGIDVVVIQPGAIISEWNRIGREGLIKYSGNGGYGISARAYAKFMERPLTLSSRRGRQDHRESRGQARVNRDHQAPASQLCSALMVP